MINNMTMEQFLRMNEERREFLRDKRMHTEYLRWKSLLNKCSFDEKKAIKNIIKLFEEAFENDNKFDTIKFSDCIRDLNRHRCYSIINTYCERRKAIYKRRRDARFSIDASGNLTLRNSDGTQWSDEFVTDNEKVYNKRSNVTLLETDHETNSYLKEEPNYDVD